MFSDARSMISGLDNPDKYYNILKDKAKDLLQNKINSRDFISAMELSDYAGISEKEKNDILLKGRNHINNELSLAKTNEEIQRIIEDEVSLEEKAGNYSLAGEIAETKLGNLDLASLLYEKANLFPSQLKDAVDPSTI